MPAQPPETWSHHLVHNGSEIWVGEFTYGSARLKVRSWGEGARLVIGKFCSLAPPITVLLGGEHNTQWVSTYPFGHIFAEETGMTPIAGHPTTRGDVVIGNDVWIAPDTTIRSGVTIGDGAVIGINSVVASDVGPYEIFAGNPARKIRDRFDEPIRSLLVQLRWWDLPLENIREILPVLTSEPSVEALEILVRRFRP